MNIVFLVIGLGALVGAAILLARLFIIDLRVYLLPDKYVFPFGVLGVFFHIAMHFSLLSPELMVAGAIVGGGLLWLVRWGGTKYYKQEAMGLGDVKLLIAAGIWLGPEHTITAIMVGAVAGLLHGIGVAAFQAKRTGTKFSLNRLIIPAGPGFIVGIVVTFIYVFGTDIAMWIQAGIS